MIEARHELLDIRHMASEMAYMTTLANAACPFNNNGLQLSKDMTESDELFLGRCLTSKGRCNLMQHEIERKIERRDR